MESIREVLFPTDFSESSTAAFNFACSLAAHYHAKLIILHVKEPPFTIGELVMPFAVETEAERIQLDETLARVQPSNPHFAVEHRLLSGRAADRIITAAENNAGCVIVMGTHGRTGLRRALMGSVAAEVVRKASCPVLTVKSPRGASAGSMARRSNKQPVG